MTYLDTSVLVAYYCPEALSPQAERAVRAENRPAISDLTEVEFVSALAQKVRRRELREREAERVAAQFLVHLGAHLYTRIPLDRRHYQLARTWISRFTRSLRTLDALHLAVAASEKLGLVTADASMAAVADSLDIHTIRLATR